MFHANSSVDPVITPGNPNNKNIHDPCIGFVSFRSKVPRTSPDHAAAMAGALDFTVRLGTRYGGGAAAGSMLWSGLYNGSGGMFSGVMHAPSACDNEWGAI
jgi:hypothetical protein